jgi:phosphotriesterase-related protein
VQFNDADAHAAVLYDMDLYREFGGRSVVENTSHGLQRNLQFMKEVSQKSGVHFIAGTGNSLIEMYIFFK